MRRPLTKSFTLAPLQYMNPLDKSHVVEFFLIYEPGPYPIPILGYYLYALEIQNSQDEILAPNML